MKASVCCLVSHQFLSVTYKKTELHRCFFIDIATAKAEATTRTALAHTHKYTHTPLKSTINLAT